MDRNEAAKLLDGNQYRNEGSKELFAQMKAAGLVAVFGASDDIMEWRGAIDDETYPNSDGAALTSAGLLKNECDDGCPYFDKLAADAPLIYANWDDGSGFSWTYTTDIPHSTFVIIETDGDEEPEQYCRGIVFALSDVPA